MEEANITYSPEEILKILPHRHPFLMVDRIVECNGKDRIVGIKCVAMNEPCFQGHFPGKPVFPGVLQLEAMAQTAGVLLNVLSGAEGQLAFYLGVDKAKFRRQVVPGDVLRMECVVLRARMGMYRVAGKTFVGGDLACEAEMMFGRGR
ncbi:MAG: 3-hydroxyacyl-ACP dehydratase FabZ [Kiritimatiellae bacterium]|nr:3-hydroxyacyl-ACP dehydratase FabZ [Kiritimatiellia bacterium]